MKLYSVLIALGLSLQAAMAQQIRITNSGPTDVTDQVVEIPWATVKAAYPQLDTAQVQVIANKRAVPYQWERRGQQTIQHLLVQVSVPAGKSTEIVLKKGKPVSVVSRTFGRYVPERFDDFAWENDRVAFRIYGAALNGRSDNAYGSDIWAKRTENLILNKWYKQNDYHKDHGEGLDYYHVGLTLGAGDIGVYLRDSIQFIHNYKSWEVLDNGPLRTTFRVKYDPYTYDGITIQTVKTYSLDAGSQLSKIQVDITHTQAKPLPMVVGITLRPEPGTLLQQEPKGILAYWEPTHGKDGTIGVGCIIPDSRSMIRKYDHGLAKVSVESGKPLVYYVGGAWDKAGKITSAEQWFTYLAQVQSQLQHPLSISY